MSAPSIFGRNLRTARRARGLTVRALGARVGVTGAAISKYEVGKSHPASSVLVALARAVEVPVECLMSETCHLPQPAPKVRPPKTRVDRARRWAAAWKRAAKEYRAAAIFNSRAARDIGRRLRGERALSAEVRRHLVAALRDRGAGCADAWQHVAAALSALDGEEPTP